MLQKDFWRNVAESNLTEETVLYAKERFDKMVEKESGKIEERNTIRNAVLETLTPDEKLTAKAVAEILEVSVQKASYHLYTLAGEGLIAKFDGNPKEYSALAE